MIYDLRDYGVSPDASGADNSAAWAAARRTIPAGSTVVWPLGRIRVLPGLDLCAYSHQGGAAHTGYRTTLVADGEGDHVVRSASLLHIRDLTVDAAGLCEHAIRLESAHGARLVGVAAQGARRSAWCLRNVIGARLDGCAGLDSPQAWILAGCTATLLAGLYARAQAGEDALPLIDIRGPFAPDEDLPEPWAPGRLPAGGCWIHGLVLQPLPGIGEQPMVRIRGAQGARIRDCYSEGGAGPVLLAEHAVGITVEGVTAGGSCEVGAYQILDSLHVALRDCSATLSPSGWPRIRYRGQRPRIEHCHALSHVSVAALTVEYLER